MKTRFEIYRDAENQYRWRAVAPENGNILATSSEGYQNRDDAWHGLSRILRALAVGAEVVVRDQEWNFNALAEGVQFEEDGALTLLGHAADGIPIYRRPW